MSGSAGQRGCDYALQVAFRTWVWLVCRRDQSDRGVLVCGFFTPDTGYEEEASRLLQSCRQHCLEHLIVAVGGCASWLEAVLFKPHFVMQCLRGIAGSGYAGVLYTDADSIVRRAPALERFVGLDFAAHWFRRRGAASDELLSGTLYFGCTPAARALVRAWIASTPLYRHHGTPEQAALAEVFAERAAELKWMRMGPEMCFICDDSRLAYPNVEPVIEHFQASRRRRHR